MTEISFGWDGTTLGDATLAEYSSREFFEDWFKFVLQYDGNMGPIDTGFSGYTGGLIVNAGSGVVTVQTGAALVNGRMYKNDAALTLTPDNTASSRVDRIILRSDPSAQTIRAVVLKGTDGSGTPPALTQTPGGTWEISLATVAITPGPTIGTITSEAIAVRTPLGPGYQSATLAADDMAQSAAAWNSIGPSGVKVTLGPGKWLVMGQLTMGNTVITAGSRYVRLYNSTSAVQLATGGLYYPAGGGPMSIPIRPTVIVLTAVNVIELQFYAASAVDIVWGDTGSTPDNDSTGFVAIRVI